LSDRFGRKPVLIVGMVLFSVASLLCAFAGGITSLIALRFLQALGGCTGQVLGRAILRDVYSGTALARVMSLMMLVMAAAPLVAPLVGSQILKVGDWHDIFFLLVALGLACLLAAVFYFKETHPESKRTPLDVAATIRGYKAIFSSRLAVGYLLTGSMAFACLFAYISGAPGVFMGYYGLSPDMFAIVFAINIAGFATGSILNSRYVGRIGIDRVLSIVVGICTTGAVVLCVLVWTVYLDVVSFAVLLFISICAMHVIFANAIAGLLNNYPSLAGTASAMFGMGQFGFGAITGALVGQFYSGGPKSMVTVMLAAMLISFSAQKFLIKGGKVPA
jgi:DHA1 family bicyclomycin/chloramphenicol resistance-like MFS transporter